METLRKAAGASTFCARGREREKTGLYELKGENNPSLHCKCSEILLRAKEQGRIAVSVSDNLRPKKSLNTEPVNYTVSGEVGKQTSDDIVAAAAARLTNNEGMSSMQNFQVINENRPQVKQIRLSLRRLRSLLIH